MLYWDQARADMACSVCRKVSDHCECAEDGVDLSPDVQAEWQRESAAYAAQLEREERHLRNVSRIVASKTNP